MVNDSQADERTSDQAAVAEVNAADDRAALGRWLREQQRRQHEPVAGYGRRQEVPNLAR